MNHNTLYTRAGIACLFLLFLTPTFIAAQIYSIPFDDRVEAASHIVKATLKEKNSYWDAEKKGIYTSNVLDVQVYLKGYTMQDEITLISYGGQVDTEAQFVSPSVQLQLEQEYILLLEEDNSTIDNKVLRSAHPNMIQATAYSSIQGAFPKKNGRFFDVSGPYTRTEAEFLEEVEKITGETALKPDASKYEAGKAEEMTAPLKNLAALTDGTGAIPSFYKAGTIEKNNELIITGTGFGTTSGTVEFTNATDGGASVVIIPTQTAITDIVHWTDTEVRVKIPSAAGTGSVEVKDSEGLSQGSTNITIGYSAPRILSNLFGFSQVTGQQIEYVDDNGQGGYTFGFNNTVNSNGLNARSTAVNAAIRSAVETLGCGTTVNFGVDTSGTSATRDGTDGINVFTFANLSPGLLGRTTTSTAVSFTPGTCVEFNTFWRVVDIDVEFQVASNLTNSTTWNFSSSDPISTENDFESVALREMGHAIGLGNVINSSAVMHFELNPGTKRRTLGAGDIEGGTFIVGYSSDVNCITSPSPMIEIITGDCALSLPVELSRFSAFPQEKTVQLQWQTTTETNNDFFVVEHSLDGKDFEQIGLVKGAGSSSVPLRYEFLHEGPIEGINYYRLVQNDFDGKFSYSKVESAFIEGINPKLDIRPNPVQGNVLQVETFMPQNGVLEIAILDIRGKLLFTAREVVEKGRTNLEVPLGDLPKGMYWLNTRDMYGNLLSTSFAKF